MTMQITELLVCIGKILLRKKIVFFRKTIFKITRLQIAVRSGGISLVEEIRNFAGGKGFLLCGGNLRRSDFDQLNLFQS